MRGLGGNGKTLLAREYALRFGPAFPGGVFWINAYGNDDSRGSLNGESRLAVRQDQLRHFAMDLGVALEGLKPEEIEAAFWRQIDVRGLDCLFIVDDVPSDITAYDLQRFWFARGTNASTLITTRSREYGAFGHQLDLEVLSPEEAVTLLTRGHRIKDTAEGVAAQQLTEALGYHPLGVEVAGSYLARGVQSLQEYLRELGQSQQHEPLEYGALLKESLPTGHDRSITRTFLKSIQALGKEGQEFLCLASLLAVAPISSGFIHEVFEAVNVKKGVRETVLEAMDQADSLSLCEKVERDSRRVHTLISRVVRSAFRNDDRLKQLKNAAVRVLCRRLSVAGDIREHTRIENEVTHARHLTSFTWTNQQEVNLATWIARHDFVRGQYTGSRKLEERVLGARVELLGKEHPETLAAMNNLALTLYSQGELGEAHKLQEQVLEASVRVLGKEHPEALKATNNLAQTLGAQGELAGARKLQEQVLEASVRLLGKEHRETLKAANNLAVTLYAQGELAEARRLQEQVFEARVWVLGKEHPDTLAAMLNLGAVLNAQGEWAGARKLEEQVLEAMVRLLGKEHPDTLRAMSNLALPLFAQGEMAAARKLVEHVFEVRLQLLGKQHPDTLTAMNNLAQALKAQGEPARARELQTQVFEARVRVLGKEHPDTLRAMNNLAATLCEQGEPAGAGKLQEQVLEARVRLLGQEHPDTLIAMNNLAQTLKALGEQRQARKLQEQALEAMVRVMGKEHPDTLIAMNNLAEMTKTQ